MLRRQASDLQASVEVATLTLEEFQAESLLVLDAGSEWHRGIVDGAVQQVMAHNRGRAEKHLCFPL